MPGLAHRHIKRASNGAYAKLHDQRLTFAQGVPKENRRQPQLCFERFTAVLPPRTERPKDRLRQR